MKFPTIFFKFLWDGCVHFSPLCQENILDKNRCKTRNLLQTRGIFFQRKGSRLAPLFPPFVPKWPPVRKMSTESTSRALSAKALATEDALSSCPPSRPISASQFFSVSAFSLAPAALHEAVTVNNSYGECYKRKNGSNPVLVGIPFFTISYNKPGDGPVTLRTLP